jgi:uncharacterized small protein (DUF1192 family)
MSDAINVQNLDKRLALLEQRVEIQFAGLAGKVDTGFASVNAHLERNLTDLHDQIATLRQEMEQQKQEAWKMKLKFTGLGALFASGGAGLSELFSVWK